MKFIDRNDAGKRLAEEVTISFPSNTIVLALPRRGVPLGIVLSKMYALSFDVILAKKIGHPFYSEYAIGAVAEVGEPFFDEAEKKLVDSSWVEEEVSNIRKEMKRRRELYDQVLKKQSLKAKDIVLVDDGIATGMTMFAAIEAVKKEQPNSIAIAVPIIPMDTYQELVKQVERIFAVEIPSHFLGAVGAYYQDFPQLEDKEVQLLLSNNQFDSTEDKK